MSTSFDLMSGDGITPSVNISDGDTHASGLCCVKMQEVRTNPNYGILIDRGLKRLIEIKSPITHVGDVIANIAIGCHSTNIGHEDSRFTWDIGTDIPRIRLRI